MNIVEIKLVQGAEKQTFWIGGESYSLMRGEPRYFKNGHPLVEKVKSLIKNGNPSGSIYSIQEDLEQLRLHKDWASLPPLEKRNILTSIGYKPEKGEKLIDDKDYVAAIKKSIETGLVTVVDDNVGNTISQEVLDLREENHRLKDSLVEMQEMLKAQKEAFTDELVEMRKAMDKLATQQKSLAKASKADKAKEETDSDKK